LAFIKNQFINNSLSKDSNKDRHTDESRYLPNIKEQKFNKSKSQKF